MSSGVPKRKRKPSRFEVDHHWYKTRAEITDLLLRDFGFSLEKAQKRVRKYFKNRPYEELDDKQKVLYDKFLDRDKAFAEWFVENERAKVLDYIRDVTKYIEIANNIYPQYWDELIKRRIYQEQAIGICSAIKQELQYSIETLPVDVNRYTYFADEIDKEITLIKSWRRSDNRFKKTVKDRPKNPDDESGEKVTIN